MELTIGRVYRLGVMHRGPREGVDFVALLDGLRQSGFVEGKNLRVEGRFSMRDEDASEVATALVAAGIDAISAGSQRRTRAAQKATRTIPIVTVADDLVLSGLVGSDSVWRAACLSAFASCAAAAHIVGHEQDTLASARHEPTRQTDRRSLRGRSNRGTAGRAGEESACSSSRSTWRTTRRQGTRGALNTR
jgi:hypothetical protein